MSAAYTIRAASSADIDALVAFTLQEAYEAEGVRLDVDDVRRGVTAGFGEDPPASYWVVESADGRIVASTSVVREWSDFRGGYYWWIQSVFITSEHRGKGLLETLLDHLARAAAEAGAIDLRLYAHSSNARALKAYRRCGFAEAPYVIMRRALPR